MRLSRHAQTLGGVRMRLSQRLSRHRRFSGRFGRVFYSVSPTQAGERVRLSQRLSRLSRFLGKSRAADMRDRLSRPYVNRAGKSVSLGWETLPPLKGESEQTFCQIMTSPHRPSAKLSEGGESEQTFCQIMTRGHHPNPHHRSALLWLSMGSPMSPTRYRSTSRNGRGMGVELVLLETQQ